MSKMIPDTSENPTQMKKKETQEKRQGNKTKKMIKEKREEEGGWLEMFYEVDMR